MENKLVVDIKLNGNEELTNQASVEEVGANKSINPPKSQNKVASSAITSALISSAKQLAMSGLGAYGSITGDYIKQQRMQDAVSLVGTAVMMMNWPVGTIAGATSLAISTISTIIETRNQNYNIDMLRQRAGTETINQSKGR